MGADVIPFRQICVFAEHLRHSSLQGSNLSLEEIQQMDHGSRLDGYTDPRFCLFWSWVFSAEDTEQLHRQAARIKNTISAHFQNKPFINKRALSTFLRNGFNKEY